jgi:uncharacterized protein
LGNSTFYRDTMRPVIIFIFFFILALKTTAQQVEKENLGPKNKIFWDKGNKKLQAIGSYYINENKIVLNKTEKHGKWSFYSFEGVLEEERMYYRNRIHGKQLTYFPNGKIKTLTYFKFNVPDSLFKEYDESGKLLLSGNYILGSPDGNWEYFYPDGTPKSIEFVQNDTVYLMHYWEEDSNHIQTIKDGNGYYKTYYNFGRVKENYTFLNGLKSGYFEERTANGAVSVKGEFISGKKSGEWVVYGYGGNIEKRMRYLQDTLNGLYEVYYNDTLLNTVGNYSMGKKMGSWRWNFPNGRTEMMGEFLDDAQHGQWVFNYPSGAVSYEAKFEKGKKTGKWQYYYENGQEYRVGTFSNDQKEGIWQTWYENGALLMAGAYTHGKETGLWKNYWESGNAKNLANFKDGVLNGTWVSYNPNNIKTAEGYYRDGLKVKEWREYYDNGRLMQISNYKIITRKNYSKDISVMGMKEKLSEQHGAYTAFSQLDYKIKAQGKYKNGLKHGVFIDYYPGGIIPTVISSYKNGKLNGTMRQFGKRGNLVYETNFKNGLKHGWLIIYDNRGKESVRKLFNNGYEVSRKNEGDQFSP